jgi:hypothetical protein
VAAGAGGYCRLDAAPGSDVSAFLPDLVVLLLLAPPVDVDEDAVKAPLTSQGRH